MSEVLDRVRGKYPVYKDVPDDELSLALGSKFPQYLDRDPSFKTEYESAVAGQSVKSAKAGTEALVGTLTNPAAAEASDAGRRQIGKERLGKEMEQARSEAKNQAVISGVANVAEKAVGAVAEMNPPNLLKRTLELPAQLGGTGYKITPLVSPETARKAVDFLDPHSYDEPGSAREGVKQALSEIASGATSPDQLAALIAGTKEPELVGRMFQVGAAAQIPEAAQQLKDAVTSGDKTAIGRAATSLAASAAIPLSIEAGLRKAKPATDLGSDAVSKADAAKIADAGAPMTAMAVAEQPALLNTPKIDLETFRGNREQTAKETGVPTETEAGRRHSTDLPEASKETQGTPPSSGETAIPKAGGKAPVPVAENKGEQNAIPEQKPDEGVLRQEGSEVGLPQVVERDQGVKEAPTAQESKAPTKQDVAPPESKPVEPAPDETPPLKVTPETIRAEFDKYDATGEHKTIDDLVTQIESMVEEDPGAPGSSRLRDAVERFREAQEDDRDLKGRGDMDEAEEKFLNRLKQAANFAEKEEKKKVSTPSDASPTQSAPTAETEKTVSPASEKSKRVSYASGSTRRFHAETELNGPDILSWMVDNMKMLSKRAARLKWGREKFRANASLYDDSARLEKPHHNIVYSDKGETPDRVAQAAYEAGILKEPSANELHAAMQASSKKRSKAFATSKREAAFMKEEAQQHSDWLKATKEGEERISADQLKKGDSLQVEGENVEVTDVDADGNVTLKDGRKFGTQVIPEGQTIHVEKFDEAPESESDFGPYEKATHWGVSVDGEPYGVFKSEGQARMVASGLSGKVSVNPVDLSRLDEGIKPEDVPQTNVVPFPTPEQAAPKLRPGEKGTGDLLQGQDQPFNLAGEKGTDADRIAAERKKSEQTAKEAKAIEAKQQQELGQTKPSDVGPGMGGAIPAEFEPGGGIATSLKNARVDAERIKRGLPAAIEPLKRSFGEVWDRAMAMIDHDPDTVDNLLDSLREKPRALTDTEDALLLHRQVDLQNDYAKATRDLAQAHDDGRTDAVTSERIRVAGLSDKLLDLYNIGKQVGTETGRGLNARKMMANEDFTLARMELEARSAKDGSRLTDDEYARVKELHDQIDATQKAYDEYRAATETRIAESESKRVLAEAIAKTVPTFDRRVLNAAEGIVRKMEDAAKPHADKLREMLSRMSAGVDPTVVYHAAFVGSAKIARLGLDLAKFTDEMVRDFGEKILPMVGDIWGEANKMVDAATSKSPEAVRRAVKKLGLPEVKEAATKAIADKVSKGQKDKITWHVQSLARALVENGVTDREALINAVHSVLQDAVPGISRRETMDAISGYGDYKQLSKDQITVQLRGMKGEMQQLAKLEDMAKGQPPLKSGVERRTPTEAERQLIKRVNDAKLKFQVPVSDPSTQLKSALDTLKTTFTNRIADYQDRIARGDFAARPRRTIELDAEASRLKAENERVKKRFQRGVAQERLKNRTRVERGADWGTKWRRGFILSGPVTLAKLSSAAVQRVLFSPIEEIAGGAISKAFPGVASRAAREGGLNTKAEAKALTQGLTEGMKDAWKTFTTGQSDLDVLHGKEALLPPSAIDFFGHVHGALKAPVKRSEFARSFEKRTAAAIAGGIDPTDPMVHSGLVIAAYKDANRAIFQQDNRVVSAYKMFLNRLELKDKATGQVHLSGKVAATTARILLPIVKIPSNIVAETMQYVTGTVTGSARLARAYAAGIENLKPEEADIIMRSLKKGSLGAAVITLGFLNPESVGGYYQPGQKRAADDVKAGNIRVFGHEIPSYLLHNPLMETLQIGATVRRVAESKLRKKDAEPQGFGAGVMAAARGQAEAVPFVRETTVVSKALDPRQSASFWGDLAKSLLVPQLVQSVANYTDKDASGNPIKRKPRTILENIESGIPGLRDRVPER